MQGLWANPRTTPKAKIMGTQRAPHSMKIWGGHSLRHPMPLPLSMCAHTPHHPWRLLRALGWVERNSSCSWKGTWAGKPHPHPNGHILLMSRPEPLSQRDTAACPDKPCHSG